MAPTAANLDWLFHLLGWTLAALGCLALLWALFRDRARGRRRCPMCWYDMRGIPALRCPECGHTARRERHLFRTRRRWRSATAAALVLAIGLSLLITPRYRDGGWVRLIPTAALVIAAPADPPMQRVRWAISLGAQPPPIRERLHRELWRRLDTRSPWGWQARLYLRRILAAHPEESPAARLLFPEAWPADRALVAQLIWPDSPGLPASVLVRLPGGQWQKHAPPDSRDITAETITLPVGPAQGPSVRADTALRLGPYTLATGPSQSTVRLGGTVATFLEQFRGPEADAGVGAALSPRLVEHGGDIAIEFYERAGRREWRPIDFAVFFTAELRVDGRTVAQRTAFAYWLSPRAGRVERSRLPMLPAAARDRLAPGALSLVLRGDPRLAGLAYCGNPFEPPRAACWAGEVVIPVVGIESAEPPPASTPAPGAPSP